MGTFGGHALPGSFFIFFGLWWTVQTYRRYYKSLNKGGKSFRATPTYLCDFLPGSAKRLQWEGILKIFFTTVGFVLEIITAFKDGKFTHLGNGQHATMFFFFGLSGVIDILVHHHPSLLPKDIDYMIGALSFTVEGILFAFHTHGRTSLDQLIHKLLVYAIGLCVICLLIEIKHRNNVLLPLSRSYAIMLQGTWFWQAGFILYNPNKNATPWDEENHEHMMIVTMMFAWHMAAIFVLILVIGFFVKLAERCCHGNHRASLGNHKYDQVRLINVSDRPNVTMETRGDADVVEEDLNGNATMINDQRGYHSNNRTSGNDQDDDDDLCSDKDLIIKQSNAGCLKA